MAIVKLVGLSRSQPPYSVHKRGNGRHSSVTDVFRPEASYKRAPAPCLDGDLGAPIS